VARIREALTQKEAANRLRITTAWVRELTNRGVLPRNPDGKYPWPEVAEHYEEFQAKKGDDGGDSDGDDGKLQDELDRERIRWTREKADAQEMENAVRRGELIPAEQFAGALRAPLEAVDHSLRTARRRLGRPWAKRLKVSQAEAMSLIDQIVEEARAHIRKAIEDAGD
jgi:hypothetical protein